ncbi:hypothetical protein ACOKM5_07640 [Streptomyces sp. BH097]|uniref:hypothetical protein n=1 Tax=unclassified Streptomyces TaxID=2593676 RepID=UPI003BB7518F
MDAELGEAVLTGPEASAVAKAGTGIVQGIKSTLAPPERSWPDAREGLMELFVILDDWCKSAEVTNAYARQVLEARRIGFEGPVRMAGPVLAQTTTPGMFSAGYIEITTADIDLVVDPAVPWWTRWRRSRNRAASRRTLRSMLRIYCPDLLGAFEEAVSNRATWITEHRGRFLSRLGEAPVADVETAVDRLEETLRDLQAAHALLHTFILENYPRLATA